MLLAASCAAATDTAASGAGSKSATAPAPAAKAKQSQGRVLSGKATVIDGDGLDIAGARIRLFGVDAPEVDQYCNRNDGTRWRCGHYATVALDRLTAGKNVVCTSRQKDRYGRNVASCTVEGRDVAAELAREGWVLAYRRYSMDYVDEEDAAKKQRAGVWAGELEAPWLWRHRAHAAGDR